MILYVGHQSERMDQIIYILTNYADGYALKRFMHLEKLIHYLHQPPQKRTTHTVALLAPRSVYEMKVMHRIANLWADIRLFVLLPDQNAEMIRQAHRLHPRCLLFQDEPLGYLKSVLQRLGSLGRMNSTRESPIS